MRQQTYQSEAVGIYDSLFLKVSLATKQDICSFLRPSRNTLIFDVMSIKSQPNANDCGLFSIACATELVYTWVCNFDCSAMRQHLLNSLTQGRIDRFPSQRRRVPLGSRVKRSVKESIFCTCRMPNNPMHAMLRCDQCQEWFHKDCEHLSIIIHKTWIIINQSSGCAKNAHNSFICYYSLHE